MTKGQLVLETGEVFTGDWLGYESEETGEVVFNTSMTGYQEMLTDPSYAGQIVTLTYPIVGNYGMNSIDIESDRLQIAGVIINDLCDDPSHFQAKTTLSEELKRNRISGLKNVDTRALVTVIRKQRTVKGRIVLEKAFPDYKYSFSVPNTKHLVQKVSVKQPIQLGKGDCHIVVLDFGYKKSIVEALLNHHCKVTIMPFSEKFAMIQALNPDGIIISNGPGNPKELQLYFPVVKKLTENYPTLGICLGHQLIALAYGADTEKLPFGHRGSNYPVKDLLTGKVKITSQNHGYVVRKDSVDPTIFLPLFQNVNDGTIEGMRHRLLPVTTVQFHPEAHPGPGDTAYMMTEFVEQVRYLGGIADAQNIK